MNLLKKELLFVPTYLWLTFFITSLVFIFIPEIDIYVSGIFFDDEKFFLKGSFFESFFYHSVPTVLKFVVITSLSIFTYNYFFKKNILGINKRVILYIILVLAIAPGLIVNVVLKEHWGRARPIQTTIFHGQKEFTPAFIISKENGKSFSCGHASAAFAMVGLAFLARKRKRFWIGAAFGYGILVSVARIIAGGHFLSDTLTSFFIVYIASLILYGFIIKGKQ